jgi:secondary thiamine-phosphate synthase enzyme
MDIRVGTGRRVEMVAITDLVRAACVRWGKTGLVHVYCPHTTAGLAVNEACDPDVATDILAWMSRQVPEGGPYAHSEGNSDAHIRCVLTGGQVTLPVREGVLLLGRWQGVFLCEFDGPRSRTLTLTFVVGEEG